MAREIIQARIDAQQDYDALVYGQRTLEEMGGRAWGITKEYGAPEWAIAQWGDAIRAAAAYGEDLADCTDGRTDCGWRLKKAKKAAALALVEAKAAVKELGGRRQVRLALAA